MKRDYYEVLGVARTATADEIKRAYRRLAMKFHPDRNEGHTKPEAELKFKECSEAYEILSDDVKKKRYDMSGDSTSSFNPSPFHADFFGGKTTWDFGRIPTMGQPLSVVLPVEIISLFQETEHTLKITRENVCSDCKGIGVAAGKAQQTCPNCQGKGSRSTEHHRSGVFARQTIVCNYCNGSGKITLPKDRCQKCSGGGRTLDSHDLTVRIPRGAPVGRQVICHQSGHEGYYGGPRGDVFVTIALKPHDVFLIVPENPFDVIARIFVPYSLAVLGGSRTLQTPEGKTISVDIPAGTQNGLIRRVAGCGLPIFGRQECGSFNIVMNVKVPKKLSPQYHSLIEQLRQFEESDDEEKTCEQEASGSQKTNGKETESSSSSG